MNWLAGKTIALSISAPEDMPQHGLGPEHFNDAMGEITRQLLALGARVMYGGDLRAGGITRMLFELAARYSPPSAHVTERTPSIINVIPYYAHAEMAAQDLDAWEAEYSEIGALLFMSPEMNRAWTRRERPNDLAPTPSERWPDSLTAMRTYVTEASDARIVVGGKASGFLGRMPGIAEEVRTSLVARKPLFVAGGYGGVAFPIARRIVSGEALELDFNVNAVAVSNGLVCEELSRLAVSPHIDEIVVLIVRGLRKLFLGP